MFDDMSRTGKLKKSLVNYFWEHYDTSKDPHGELVHYDDIVKFMKKVECKEIQETIYQIGMFEIARAVTLDILSKL